MELATTAALTALVKKVVDFFKYAANKDVNAVVTQLVAWVTGVAVMFLAKNSDFAGGIDMQGTLLANLNNWSITLIGVNLSSIAGVAWDAIKAFDNTNSAVVPNLIGPTHVSAAPVDSHHGPVV